MKSPIFTRKPSVLNAAVLSTLLTIPAIIQTAQAADNQYQFDISKGSLGGALTQIGEASGSKLLVPSELINGLTTQGISGRYTLKQALQKTLDGSGLGFTVNATNKTINVIKAADKVETLDTVHVDATVEGFFGDAPPEPGGFKAEYQTTATKMAMPLKETPQAISVVTRESMDARQVRDVTSALELTAGVSTARAADGGPFAGRGLGGGEGFVLRGQELDGKRDVRIDGVMVSSNIFDLAAYERVEVIKGPSSALYGQTSLGGMINLIRKKPKTQYEGSVSGVVGSFNTRRLEVDVTGPLDEKKHLLGRITVAHDNSEAFIDDVETRTSLIATSLEAHISDQTRILFQLLYQDDEYTPSRGVPLRLDGDQLKIPDVSRSLFAGVPSQEKSNAQNYLVSVGVDHEISDRWLVNLILQKGGQSRERFFDGYANTGYLDSTGDIYIYSDTSTTEDDNWSGELRLNGEFNALGREHQILVGLEHSESRTDLAFGYTYLGGGNLYTGDFAADSILSGGAGNQDFDYDTRTNSTSTAPYLQMVLNPVDRVKLLIGARYDFSDIKRTDNISNTVDKSKDEVFTARIGLSWKMNDNVSLYGNYGQSFEPAIDARSVSGEILKPVTGDGVELGIKTEWLGGKLGSTMAVFQQELDGIPITDPNNTNFQINGGLQRTRGAEFEVTGAPLPGLTIGAALTLLNSEFIDPRDDNYGLSPDGIKKQGSFFASYEIQKGLLRGLVVGGSFISVGERQVLGFGMNEYMEGYERVDLNFSYKAFDNLDISLNVRNLFDKKYIERVRDRYQDNFFGAPRAALLKTTYHF